MSAAPKILVVDDEPSMRRYIATLLEVESYAVDTAESGEEAIARIQAGLIPDLVLLDVLMPGLDGLQTLEHLRRIQPQLKVIMLSCVSDTRKVAQAIRTGALDYVTKPFQQVDLQEVIEQALGRGPSAVTQAIPGEIEDLGDGVFF